MAFSVGLSSQSVIGPSYFQILNDQMFTKARVFAKNDNEVYEYIKDILENNDFQNCPKKYLDDWREQRGQSEKFRYPEDEARRFFDQNFKFQRV